MIGIIYTNKEELSKYEFLYPVEEILKEKNIKYKIFSYKEKINENIEKIIITGTAIMDFDYLNYLDNFRFIIENNIKTLAICSGSQILTKLLGYNLIEKEIIGKYRVKIIKENKLIDKDFDAYFIITKIPEIDNKFEIYGVIENIPALFNYKNIYFSLFHPEVLNKEIIINFIDNI
ncbi:MAG: glutamine amidotransferase-related protein [Nanopusillaceae archaeon]